jgi:hypothetical protein
MTNLFVAYLCKSCSVRGCSSLVRKLVWEHLANLCRLQAASSICAETPTICGRQMHVTLKASYRKPLAFLIVNCWCKKRWNPGNRSINSKIVGNVACSMQLHQHVSHSQSAFLSNLTHSAPGSSFRIITSSKCSEISPPVAN